MSKAEQAAWMGQDSGAIRVLVREGTPLVVMRSSGERLDRRQFAAHFHAHGCDRQAVMTSTDPDYRELAMANEDHIADGNRPEIRFQFGGVSASVFVNKAKRTDGTTFEVRRVTLRRVYRDANNQYQVTNSLDIHDLPKAILSLQRAYEHCLGAREQASEGDD